MQSAQSGEAEAGLSSEARHEVCFDFGSEKSCFFHRNTSLASKAIGSAQLCINSGYEVQLRLLDRLSSRQVAHLMCSPHPQRAGVRGRGLSGLRVGCGMPPVLNRESQGLYNRQGQRVRKTGSRQGSRFLTSDSSRTWLLSHDWAVSSLSCCSKHLSETDPVVCSEGTLRQLMAEDGDGEGVVYKQTE